MSKAQKQDVYRLRDERYGINRPNYVVSNSKEFSNLKRQVSTLSKKADDPLNME